MTANKKTKFGGRKLFRIIGKKRGGAELMDCGYLVTGRAMSQPIAFVRMTDICGVLIGRRLLADPSAHLAAAKKTAAKTGRILAMDLRGGDWRSKAKMIAGFLLVPVDQCGKRIDAPARMYELDARGERIAGIVTSAQDDETFLTAYMCRHGVKIEAIQAMIGRAKEMLAGAHVRTEAETTREASMKIAGCAAIANKKNSGGANRLHGDQLVGRVTNATRGATAAA